jgi:hypothetical protein
MAKQKSHPEIPVDVLWKFINPFDPDANQVWTSAFTIQTKLHTALAVLTRPDRDQDIFLDIPFVELKANPEVARKYEAELKLLTRLIPDRIPAGPVDPTALDPMRFRMILGKLNQLMDSIKTATKGKAFRKVQSDKGKKRGDQLHAKAAPDKERILAERDRLLKKKDPPSERGMARIIAQKLDRPFNTVRDILRNNSG